MTDQEKSEMSDTADSALYFLKQTTDRVWLLQTALRALQGHNVRLVEVNDDFRRLIDLRDVEINKLRSELSAARAAAPASRGWLDFSSVILWLTLFAVWLGFVLTDPAPRSAIGGALLVLGSQALSFVMFGWISDRRGGAVRTGSSGPAADPIIDDSLRYAASACSSKDKPNRFELGEAGQSAAVGQDDGFLVSVGISGRDPILVKVCRGPGLWWTGSILFTGGLVHPAPFEVTVRIPDYRIKQSGP